MGEIFSVGLFRQMLRSATPVALAVKSHLRGGKPVVLAFGSLYMAGDVRNIVLGL